MSIVRAAVTIGSCTLAGRVIGFVREIITAAVLGAGPLADAYFIALRLPGLFRTLFDEGVFTTGFVPLFSRTAAEHGREATRIYVGDAFAALLVALVAVVVLAELFMPAIMFIVAPGFAADPDKFALAVELTRITFPYLLFVVLFGLLGSALNAVDRFAAAAAAPILPNLFLILTLVFMAAFQIADTRFLAAALTAGGVAQLFWLMVACARAGLRLRLPRPRLTPGVRRVFAVISPGILGVGVTQLNLMISMAVASLLPSGAVSYLYYADRLNELPLGVIGIAVGTAILPQLTRQVLLSEFGSRLRDAEPGHRAGAALKRSGRSRGRFAGSAHLFVAVPARRVWSGRRRSERCRAHRLCRWSAGIYPGQGAGTDIFRPRRYGDTGPAGTRRDGGQSGVDAAADAAFRPYRGGTCDRAGGVGQRPLAARGIASPRAFPPGVTDVP